MKILKVYKGWVQAVENCPTCGKQVKLEYRQSDPIDIFYCFDCCLIFE